MTQKLFLFAGEKSGDLLGKHLMQSLKGYLPDCEFVGVGGEGMRAEMQDCWVPMEKFQVMGFSAVIRALPKIIRLFFQIRGRILRNNPEAVILIDYPGFNLKLAESLRKKGYKGKIVQYVSPTVWAWGKKRIPRMVKTLDLLLCTYPFEEKFWEAYPLKTTYVGNPVKERVQEHTYDKQWRKQFNIAEKKEIIALFPGSRESEITAHLPILLKACEKIKSESPEPLFALSCANRGLLPKMEQIIQQTLPQLRSELVFVPQEFRYELMQDSKSAIAKSGTVTLELALHQCPSTVFYSVAGLNYLIAKYWIKPTLPYYCMVNILQEKEVFPEWIEKGATPDDIARSALLLHQEGQQRALCIEECRKMIDSLGDSASNEQAAKAITHLLQN